jgi:hypothetical protein
MHLIKPLFGRGNAFALHRVHKRSGTRSHIAHKRGCNLDIGIHLGGFNVHLNELLASRFAPLLALAV